MSRIGDLIVATSLATGEEFRFRSGKALIAAGFNRIAVNECIQGYRKDYAGFTFVRVVESAQGEADKCLALLAAGLTVGQVVEEMGISRRAVFRYKAGKVVVIQPAVKPPRPRIVECAKLMGLGLNTKAIAEKMGVAVTTARRYKRNAIYKGLL